MFPFTESLIQQKKISREVHRSKKPKIDLFDMVRNSSQSEQEDIQTFNELKDWVNSYSFEKNEQNISRNKPLMNNKYKPNSNNYHGLPRKIASLQINNQLNDQALGYQMTGTGLLDVVKQQMKSRSNKKTIRRASQNISLEGLQFNGGEGDDKSQKKEAPNLKKSSANSSRSFNGYDLINQYQIREKIGEGAFSSVHLCIDIHTEKKYAMKILSKKSFRKKLFRKNSSNLAENYMQNQIAILKKMQHLYVIKLYEVVVDEQQQKTYLVIDYCPNGFIGEEKKSNVEETQSKYRKLLQSESKRYFKQLLLALDYIHTAVNIAHRDIKPQNILLSDKDEVKLSDFGLGTEDIEIASKSGTRSFIPPQMLNQNETVGKKINTQKSDIWALGVTLLILLTGKHTQVEVDTIKNIIANIKDISSECQDFMLQCLEVNWQKRPSSSELLNHPWINVQKPKQYPQITISIDDTNNAINYVHKQILSAITKLHMKQ